jgi:WD40 repeat protein
VIDQLEELVSLCSDEHRRLFLTLVDAALRFDPRLHVLVALRVEFLGPLQAEPTGSLFTHPYGLAVLPPERIREVIMGPARAAGVELEDGLAELIMSEATGGDVLPLLGYLLQQLYSGAARDGRITRKEYDDAGRVSGAIARQADHVLTHLSVVYSSEDILETLLRFVSWEGPEPTRRRVRLHELAEQERTILQEFREARLIVDVSDQDALDLAHEALLRQWEPLSLLVRSREAALRRRTELEPLTLAWERSGRRDDYLIRGAQLREAEELMNQRTLSPLVAEYVLASLTRWRAELRRTADQLADRSLELVDDDPELALALASAAIEECFPTPHARSALRAGLDNPLRGLRRTHVGVVWAVAWSVRGELASAGGDGTVQVWPLSSAEDVRLLSGHGGGALAVAWSPDGRLTSGGGDGRVLVRANGSAGTRTLDTTAGRVPTVAWSEDGRLAGGGSDGAVRVWTGDSDTPVVLTGHDGDVYSVAWSAAGWLASGGADGTVRVWDERLVPVWEARLDPAGGIWSVSWSATGSLAVGGGSGAVWVSPDGATSDLRCLKVPGGGVFATAWSPRGWLTCGSDDGTIRVWNEGVDARPIVLEGHGGEVFSLAWSTDERLASCGGHHGAVYVWEPALGAPQVLATQASVQAMSWSPDGRLAAGGTGRRVQVWSTDLDSASWSPRSHDGSVLSLGWSDDGSVVSTDGSQVQTWSPGSAVGPSTQDIGPVSALDCSGDGRLGLGGQDGTVRVWRPGLDQQPVTLGAHSGAVSAVAWAADGRLASGGADGTIRVWQPDAGAQLVGLGGHSGAVSAVAWAADGRLASGGADGAVRVWQPDAGHAGRTLRGGIGPISSLAWSAGAWLTAGGREHVVVVWRLAETVEAVRAEAAQQKIRRLTPAERRRYQVPD